MSAEIDMFKILSILPHRYPFLLIDRVKEVQLQPDGPIGSWIEGIKNVTFNEPVFQGHFPGYPVFPGVLTLESMAQLGALLVSNFAPGKTDDFTTYLSGFDAVRFRSPITPGDTVRIKIVITKERKRLFWVCHGEAFVDNQLACEADLMASVIPKKRGA